MLKYRPGSMWLLYEAVKLNERDRLKQKYLGDALIALLRNDEVLRFSEFADKLYENVRHETAEETRARLIKAFGGGDNK